MNTRNKKKKIQPFKRVKLQIKRRDIKSFKWIKKNEYKRLNENENKAYEPYILIRNIIAFFLFCISYYFYYLSLEKMFQRRRQVLSKKKMDKNKNYSIDYIMCDKFYFI